MVVVPVPFSFDVKIASVSSTSLGGVLSSISASVIALFDKNLVSS